MELSNFHVATSASTFNFRVVTRASRPHGGRQRGRDARAPILWTLGLY